MLGLADLPVGYRDGFTTEITTDLIAGFAALSGDHAPLHTDAAFAQAQGFDGCVAHGLLLGALISRLVGMQLPGAGGILQSIELGFRAPVVAPTTVRVEGEVTGVSASTGQLQIKVKVATAAGRCLAEGRVRSIVRPATSL